MANQSLADLRSTTPEAMIGKRSEEIPGMKEEDIQIFIEMDEEVQAKRGPVDRNDLLVTKPNGEQSWRHIIKVPISDEYNEFIGIVGISSDVSRRVAAETKAQEQQQLFEAVINAVPHIIYAKGLDGRFLMVNQEMADFRNTTREALVDLTVEDLPGISIEEAEMLAELDRRAFLENHLVENPEMFIHKADGTPSWRRMMKRPLHDEAGNITAIVGVGEDITARHNAEEALRTSQHLLQTVFDALPVSLFFKDNQLRYRMVNRSAVEFYGLDQETMIGMTADDLPGLNSSNTQLISRTDRQVLEDGKIIRMTDQRVNQVNGKPSLQDITKVPIKDGKGDITGVLVLSADITDKVRLEEELRHSQKMDAIGQLSGGVAHDFNNLLTVVLGNLELLKQRLGPDHEWLKYVSRSSEAAERGAMLTQRMLAFSRKQSLNPISIDLNKLVDGLMNLIQSSLGETIAVTLTLHGDVWPVYVDRYQLENAIINLAVNSRDAMPDGGRLTLTTRNIEVEPDLAGAHGVDPGPFVALSVSDTGMGMPEEVLTRAVDPFYTTKEVGKGSGLGLSMIYGFLKQSGGILQMESEVGEGTAMRLLIPRAPQSEAVVQPEESAEWAHDGASEIILVVEDDPDVRQMAMDILTGMGYVPLEAENAHQALEVLEREQKVALIFSDLVMPGGIDGRVLVEKAREMRPTLPVVLTSGYSGQVLAGFEPLEQGMVLLPKPYQPFELSRAIRKALST